MAMALGQKRMDLPDVGNALDQLDAFLNAPLRPMRPELAVLREALGLAS